MRGSPSRQRSTAPVRARGRVFVFVCAWGLYWTVDGVEVVGFQSHLNVFLTTRLRSQPGVSPGVHPFLAAEAEAAANKDRRPTEATVVVKKVNQVRHAARRSRTRSLLRGLLRKHVHVARDLLHHLFGKDWNFGIQRFEPSPQKTYQLSHDWPGNLEVRHRDTNFVLG